jgi:hypothetical protein
VRTIWAILLVAFAALNLYALAIAGITQLVAYPTTLPAWGVVATVDLLLALGVGLYWTVLDARRRRVSAVPFIILTCLTGSVGLLAYLVAHGAKRSNRARSILGEANADVSTLSGIG